MTRRIVFCHPNGEAENRNPGAHVDRGVPSLRKSAAPSARPRRSALVKALQIAHHAIFDASRGGRATEIASWANAASALTIGAGTAALLWSRLGANALWAGAAALVVVFAGLRLSLAHRVTVWIAGAFGTVTVAALGGSLAWLFGHVVEAPAVPSVAAVVGAVFAALAPAWSYTHIARLRSEHVRDSLLAPLSAPRSR